MMKEDYLLDDEIKLSNSEFKLYKDIILELSDEYVEKLDLLIEKVMMRAEKDGYEKFLNAQSRG